MSTDTTFINSLKVRRIDPAMTLADFKCNDAIDWFLTERACDHHQKCCRSRQSADFWTPRRRVRRLGCRTFARARSPQRGAPWARTLAALARDPPAGATPPITFDRGAEVLGQRTPTGGSPIGLSGRGPLLRDHGRAVPVPVPVTCRGSGYGNGNDSIRPQPETGVASLDHTLGAEPGEHFAESRVAAVSASAYVVTAEFRTAPEKRHDLRAEVGFRLQFRGRIRVDKTQVRRRFSGEFEFARRRGLGGSMLDGQPKPVVAPPEIERTVSPSVQISRPA